MSREIKFTGKTLDPTTARALADDVLIQGARPVAWWRRQGTELHNKFMDTVRISMENGEGIDKLTKRISGGVIDGVQVPGIMKAAKSNAEALGRTAVNKVTNEARLRTFESNDDVVKGIKQVSTLDNRTSVICVAYDGQTWSLPGYEPIPPSTLAFNGGPPRHFNCRSTLVPVLKSWEELGIPLKDLSPGTRASMDGQVPADQTFDAFLKKKGKSFQDKLLGATRARLWRSGKITLQQMLDFKGNPLTPDQLTELAKKRRARATAATIAAKPAVPQATPTPAEDVPEFTSQDMAERWVTENMVAPGKLASFTKGADRVGLRVAMQTTRNMEQRFGIKKANFIGDPGQHPSMRFRWSSKNNAAVHMESDSLLFKKIGVDRKKLQERIDRDQTPEYKAWHEKRNKGIFESLLRQAKEMDEPALVDAIQEAIDRKDWAWTVGDPHFTKAEEKIAQIFIHENGHRFHQVYRDKLNPILADLRKNSKRRYMWMRQTSEYGMSDDYEFIAEQFVRYVYGEKKRVYPPLYKFFKSVDKGSV